MKSPFLWVKSPCSHGFPMVFPCYPEVFPWFSHGFSAGSSTMTQLLETLEADPALGHIFQAQTPRRVREIFIWRYCTWWLIPLSYIYIYGYWIIMCIYTLSYILAFILGEL